MVEAHTWLLNSVKEGRYNDLSGVTFRAKAILEAMLSAAEAMQILKLIETTKAGLERLKTEQQLDASTTIETWKYEDIMSGRR